ncbi:Myb-related protein [Acrasis kona]|uniref:Myb-related protein n=1 Tax=Acrasis kona TaxID=1008807 RepID=A0AAW2YGW5_9EUKA
MRGLIKTNKSKTKRTCARWTEDENRRLVEAVVKYEGKNWQAIAEEVANKTQDQCNQHWHRVINPLISKDPWTEEEDEILVQAVSDVGESSWKKVSERLVSKYTTAKRTDLQCRHRWIIIKKNREKEGHLHTVHNIESRRPSPVPTRQPSPSPLLISELGHESNESPTPFSVLTRQFSPSPIGHESIQNKPKKITKSNKQLAENRSQFVAHPRRNKNSQRKQIIPFYYSTPIILNDMNHIKDDGEQNDKINFFNLDFREWVRNSDPRYAKNRFGLRPTENSSENVIIKKSGSSAFKVFRRDFQCQ